MTPAELNQLRMGLETARKNLNDSISAVNGADDEQRSELMGVFETREKAFQDSGDGFTIPPSRSRTRRRLWTTAEKREIRTIESRVSLHKYLEASFSRRSVDGAELEYNSMPWASRRAAPWTCSAPETAPLFPLSLFAPRLEKRSKTDVDVSTRPSGWVDRLFENTRAAHLGIGFSAAPAGVRSLSADENGRNSGAARTQGSGGSGGLDNWGCRIETRQNVHSPGDHCGGHGPDCGPRSGPQT